MMNTIGVVFLTVLAVQCVSGESLRGLGQVRRDNNGDCPYQKPKTYCEPQGLLFSSEDESDCYDDTECSSTMKCCRLGCGKKCVEPVHYSTWTDAPVDMAIVFDANQNTWEKVKNMTKQVINAMAVSKDVTHIALVTTALPSQTLLKFSQLNDSEISCDKVLSIIDGFEPPMRPGKLGKALKKAKEMFKKSNGAREDAIKVLLVISDANTSPKESNHTLATSEFLKKSGVLVNTIGITMEMSLMHLVEIATSDYYVWPGVDHELLGMLKELEKKPGDVNHSSQIVGLSKL